MTLTRLPDNTPALLRAAGLHVVEIPGWQTRGRDPEHGPFGAVGNLWHHTGSSDKIPASTKDDLEYARWLFLTGRDDLPAPLCNLSIGRNGTVYLGASGRANHAGKARASGPIAAGDGNRLYVGIECQNNGTEGFKKPQYEAMVVTGMVLSSKIVKCSSEANRAHKETSVTGKWDPGALVMSRFREDIHAAMNARKAPPMNNVQKAHVKLAQAQTLMASAIGDLEKAPKDRTVVRDGAVRLRSDLVVVRADVAKIPEA